MADYTHVISGLVRRRDELRTEAATLSERQAVIANDLEAIDRILESLGHSTPVLRPARAARIILFYRNELQTFLRAELAKAVSPMLTRELAVILCQMEGKRPEDRRLLADVTRRVSRALALMRDKGEVASEGLRKSVRWSLARVERPASIERRA